MSSKITRIAGIALVATSMLVFPATAMAQETDLKTALPASTPTVGPEIKGVITARRGDKMQITADDGTKTVVMLTDATAVESPSGLLGLGKKKYAVTSLINGLPVTVKTMQNGDLLQVALAKFRGGDLRTANIVKNGTAQGFEEQTAATGELRSHMADIDQYNVKGSTNALFATGKSKLTEQAKADLCATVTQAEAIDGALLLVNGYTDSVGSDDYNQRLSDNRAARVVNYLQQVCKWKPYRLLTPSGMSESDPVASNDDSAGKAQNRRVTVTILVSNGLEGL
jgi:outer membrane protein OmpA-like peptidoglycan-associated protein